MKLKSAKCPWCAGNCLLWVQCLRWYCCDAVDCGESSWCSVWSGLFIILLNSWSSHFSSSSPNSGRSAGQKPHRLLQRRNASTRWRSVVVIKPLLAGNAYVSRDSTTVQKMACRPAVVSPWCRSTLRLDFSTVLTIKSEYSVCDLICDIITLCIWSCDMGTISVCDKSRLKPQKEKCGIKEI